MERAELRGECPRWPGTRLADPLCRYRPWYDHVEQFIGVSGQTEVLFETSPYGRYLPPMPLNCIEQHVSGVLSRDFPGMGLQPQATAVLTRPLGDRQACHFCGPCHRGCSIGGYFSSLSSTLPAAEKTGNLTKLTDTIVAGLDYDPITRRIVGVRTINQNSRQRQTFAGRIIFLNASTIATTQIMLMSRSETFPNGLANSSGVLGHYLMDHIGVSTRGTYDLFSDHLPLGNRPNGIYIPRFQNVHGQQKDFYRGYGFTGGADRTNWTRGMSLPGYGKDLKATLRRPGPWTMTLSGMGECLPYRQNRVGLDEKNRDAWDLPQVAISFDWGDNERRMASDVLNTGEAIHKAAGAVRVERFDKMDLGGRGIHEMGTARMGRDPSTSVLNGFNQTHDIDNLFVTDGACMASSAAQNPSLTYMALTARAADYAVTRMKTGAL